MHTSVSESTAPSSILVICVSMYARVFPSSVHYSGAAPTLVAEFVHSCPCTKQPLQQMHSRSDRHIEGGSMMLWSFLESVKLMMQ